MVQHEEPKDKDHSLYIFFMRALLVGSVVGLVFWLALGLTDDRVFSLSDVHRFWPDFVYWFTRQWWIVLLLPLVLVATFVIVTFATLHTGRLLLGGDWAALNRAWIGRSLGTSSSNGNLVILGPDGRHLVGAVGPLFMAHEVVWRLRLHLGDWQGWSVVYADLAARWNWPLCRCSDGQRRQLEGVIYDAERTMMNEWLERRLMHPESFATRRDWWWHIWKPQIEGIAGVNVGTLRRKKFVDEDYELEPQGLLGTTSDGTAVADGSAVKTELMQGEYPETLYFVETAVVSYMSMWEPDNPTAVQPWSASNTGLLSDQIIFVRRRMGPGFLVFWEPPTEWGTPGQIVIERHPSMTQEITGIPCLGAGRTLIDIYPTEKLVIPEWVKAAQNERVDGKDMWKIEEDLLDYGVSGSKVAYIIKPLF